MGEVDVVDGFAAEDDGGGVELEIRVVDEELEEAVGGIWAFSGGGRVAVVVVVVEGEVAEGEGVVCVVLVLRDCSVFGGVHFLRGPGCLRVEIAKAGIGVRRRVRGVGLYMADGV